jgi:hypothetical protein
MEQVRLAYELHRPKRKRFPTRPVEIKGLNESWQADLVEMQHLSKWNRGHRYLLTVIDTFSKRAYAEPIKSKTAQDVASAMQEILNRAKTTPVHLQTDMGKEFFNSQFKTLMTKNNINHYHTYSPLKASIVERFNRTLKSIMYRYFTEKNTLNWVAPLQALVKEYNHKPHSTIGMKPAQVSKKNERRVLQKIRRTQQRRLKGTRPKKKFELKAGDVVRLSRYKNVFEKGYTPNWTEELFKVTEVLSTRPRTFRVVDMLNTPIKGTFYAEELQRTAIPGYGRIEKVLGRKTMPDGRKMIRVKWKNHDARFNQWIPLDSSMKL